MGYPGRIRGYLGKISGYLKRKQPKTCVWVSAVGGRAFLQRSLCVLSQDANFKIRGDNTPFESERSIIVANTKPPCNTNDIEGRLKTEKGPQGCFQTTFT